MPYRRNERLYHAYGFLMGFALWGGIWIKYLVDGRGLELKWILAMDLPFWLMVALLQAPMGALADHIGRRAVMLLAAVTYALTILGFGITTNYWMLFADYMLWAVAMALQSGTDSALMYDSLKAMGEESRFSKLAGRQLGLVLASGMVSVVLGGWLAAGTSMAFAVVVSGFVPLLAIPVVLFMREPPMEHEERHYWRNLGAGFTFAWRTPPVRYTLLLGSVLLTGTFGPVVLIQPFLSAHEVSTGLFGVYQAPLRLVSVVAAIVAFRVAAKMGMPRVLLLGCAGVVVSYVGLALVDASPAFAFFGLSSLMTGLTRPVIDTFLNDRIPSERRATVLSVMQLAFSLQVAFFEPALGFFADDVSLEAAFWFAAVYCAVLMPPLLVFWWRAKRGEERSAKSEEGAELTAVGYQLAPTGESDPG